MRVSRFNKSQSKNFSTVNQSNSFLEEMRGLVAYVKSLVESHMAGGPTMAFEGFQTKQYQPHRQFTKPVCPIRTH